MLEFYLKSETGNPTDELWRNGKKLKVHLSKEALDDLLVDHNSPSLRERTCDVLSDSIRNETGFELDASEREFFHNLFGLQLYRPRPYFDGPAPTTEQKKEQAIQRDREPKFIVGPDGKPLTRWVEVPLHQVRLMYCNQDGSDRLRLDAEPPSTENTLIAAPGVCSLHILSLIFPDFHYGVKSQEPLMVKFEVYATETPTPLSATDTFYPQF